MLLNEHDLEYSEDFDFEDYYQGTLEEDLSYIEDFDLVDYGIEEGYDEDCGYDDYGRGKSARLHEDLNSSLPVTPMSESDVRSAAKKVVKGAKVSFGYFKELKLDSKYAQGKFVKKEGRQYDLVKAIKVTEVRGCTGVNYAATEGAVALHNTQEYQNRLAAKVAATGKGFGTNVHDTEAGLENILLTTASGKKCVVMYPLTISRPKNKYYISINGEDWRQTTKEEIADYMSPSAAEDFLHPENAAEKAAKYQARIYAANGINASVSELTIVDDNGETLKIKTHPVNITYKDSVSPFFGIYKFDKETAIAEVLPPNDNGDDDDGGDDPFGQDFPEVDK